MTIETPGLMTEEHNATQSGLQKVPKGSTDETNSNVSRRNDGRTLTESQSGEPIKINELYRGLDPLKMGDGG